MHEKRVSWEGMESLNKKLVEKLDKERFDCLLCIGSGGLILGKLIADSKAIPLSAIIANSYDKGEKSKKQVKLSNIATISPLKGKVLVVDDLADSGETLEAVIELLKTFPNITNIKTAVTFTKPHSKITPDYYVEETSSWIIFPYEKVEFQSDQS
ncbi:MAG: hypothetical protein KKB31_05450 [Nanoarchaeota archaeon]|nr:hypothetical protein [Nanoarchaeota archaeon]